MIHDHDHDHPAADEGMDDDAKAEAVVSCHTPRAAWPADHRDWP